MPYEKKDFVRPEIKCIDGRKAVIWWDNQKIHLGPWDGKGTPPSSVLARYLRECARLEEHFYARKLGSQQPEPEQPTCIVTHFEKWLLHLRTHRLPSGDLRKDGTLSSHYEKAGQHARPLLVMYGDTYAEHFTVEDLERLQVQVQKPVDFDLDDNSTSWHPPDMPRNHCRRWGDAYTNEAINDIRRFFRWLEKKGKVPKGTTHHLSTLESILLEPEERQLPEPRWITATMAHTSPQIACLIQLQLITAARPSELLIMRPGDIEIDGDQWTLRPYQHKLLHKRKRREIPLGSRCQELLAPFLEGRPPEAYVFKPAEVFQWWRRHNRQHRQSTRTTPVYPCEVRRRRQEKAKRRRRKCQRKRKFEFQDYYDRRSYRQAIHHAVAKAIRAGHDIEYWNPYDLRHASITTVQELEGWEAGAAHAGHHHESTTAKYAHRAHEARVKLAREVQSKLKLYPEPGDEDAA